MAHTYGSCLYHYVFSTKDRRATIRPEWMPRLWEYVGGIARENGMKTLCVGGRPDHAHVLLAAPPVMSPAKAIQLLKGGSSKRGHDAFSHEGEFGWQEGYAVFSVSFSNVDAVRRYILDQEKHHVRRTFEEEYRAFLIKHRIAFDERYLLG
jgi:REP element-mobilizing transposase RayT